jgi:hypothetical protein
VVHVRAVPGWDNSRRNVDEFHDRVRLYMLDEAKIWKPIDRVRCAKYWLAELKAIEAEMAGVSPSVVSDEDFKSLRHIGDFANHVGNILHSIADRVQSRNFDEFLEYGFDDPPGGGA